ncbi:MAG: capsid protein [Cressdnaviricota sp.]|nr:MAG: capsid protein [Cressdnaviricota sp.]
MKTQKRQFKSKKLPMATKKIDFAQNKKIVNLEKKIKKIEGEPELKYSNKPIQETAVAGLGVVGFPLNDTIAQGLEPNQRIGNKITATSLSFKGILVTDQGRLGYSIFRVMVYWYSDQIAASPVIIGDDLTGTRCMLTVADGLVSSPSFALPYSRAYVPKTFKVLYDKTYVLNANTYYTDDTAGTVTRYAPVSKNIQFKIPLNRVIQFDNDGIGLASMAGNSLYIAVIADNTNSPGILSGCTRFNYRDM